jgi:pyroglutamyl-peptidase
MAILLTGFDAYRESIANSSELLVDALTASCDSTYHNRIRTSILPTQYDLGGDEIVRLIRGEHPSVVLALGMHEEDSSIRIEHIARNWDSYAVPDNVGTVRLGQAIIKGAPASYDSTLPINRIVNVMKQLPIDVKISLDAGNSVCNHVFFRACHEIQQSGRRMSCGFIHVPPASGYYDVPEMGLPLEAMVQAIALCLDVLLHLESPPQELISDGTR